MSQLWALPLENTQPLSTSRPDINDGFASLKSCFVGTSDPSSLFEEGFMWINNTAPAKLKGRTTTATFNLGDWGVDNLGHLRADGTKPLTANWDVGNFNVQNVKQLVVGSNAIGAELFRVVRIASGAAVSAVFEHVGGGATDQFSLGIVGRPPALRMTEAVGLNIYEFRVDSSPAVFRLLQNGSLVYAHEQTKNLFSIVNRLVQTCPSTAPTDGDIGSSQFSIWLDEVSSPKKLTFRVKTSLGALLTGTVDVT